MNNLGIKSPHGDSCSRRTAARRGTGPDGPGPVSEAARTGTAPGQQALARSRQDRRALVVMTIAHGIQHFYVAGLAVTYPFVVAQFHVS